MLRVMDRQLIKIHKPVTTISITCTNKTEVVYQQGPGTPNSELTITVNGQRLQIVYKSHFLVSGFVRAVQINAEVTARSAKVTEVFG